MGEAKRRKIAGLPPKSPKLEDKRNTFNSQSTIKRIPLYLGIGFVIYLIYDLIHYYTQG